MRRLIAALVLLCAFTSGAAAETWRGLSELCDLYDATWTQDYTLSSYGPSTEISFTCINDDGVQNPGSFTCPGDIEIDSAGERFQCLPIPPFVLAAGPSGNLVDFICSGGNDWWWDGAPPEFLTRSTARLTCVNTTTLGISPTAETPVNFEVMITCDGEISFDGERTLYCGEGVDSRTAHAAGSDGSICGTKDGDDPGYGLIDEYTRPSGSYAYNSGPEDPLSSFEDAIGNDEDEALPGLEPVGPQQTIRFCILDENGGAFAATHAEYYESFIIEIVSSEPGFATTAHVGDFNGAHDFEVDLLANMEAENAFWSVPLVAAAFVSAPGETNTIYVTYQGMSASLAIGYQGGGISVPAVQPRAGLSAELVVAEPPLAPLRIHEIQLDWSGEDPDHPIEILRVEIEGRPIAGQDPVYSREALSLVAGLDGKGCSLNEGLNTAEGAYLHSLDCRPDEAETLAFAIAAPDIAVLGWQITGLGANSADDVLGSWAGEIEIAATHDGSGAVAPATPTPVVLNAFPVRTQLGLDEFGGPVTEVPKPGDPLGTRYLLVMGRDLPLRRLDAVLASDDELEYYFYESAETLSEAELVHSHLAVGLKRFAGPEADPAETLALLRAGGIDAVVIEANLPAGALTGPRNFTVNGAPVSWLLEYADTALALSFRRERAGDAAGGIDALSEAVELTFGDEDLFLVAQLSPAHLALDEIRTKLELYDGDTGQTELRDVTLTRTAPGIYRSPALRLRSEADRMGDIVLSAGDGDYSRLSAVIAPDQLEAQLPFATGAFAQVLLDTAPAQSEWDRYIEQAATCSGYEYHPALAADLAFEGLAYDDGDPLGNTIIEAGFETVTQDVRVGHHAGLLFLRRSFLTEAAAEEERLANLLNDRALLMEQYMLWRQGYDLLLQDDPESPLFKIEVTGAPLRDKTTLGEIVRFAPFLSGELRSKGLDDNAILAWIEGRNREAVAKLLEGLRKSNKALREVSACDIPGLLTFARGLEVIAARTEPQLVRKTALGWEPDIMARRWLRSSVSLAQTWYRQQRASEQDTKEVMLVAAIFTFPLSFAESGVISGIGAGLEAVDAAFSLGSSAQRYAASRAELARAFGMSAVIGDARYREAERTRVNLSEVGLDLGMALAGLSFDGLSIWQGVKTRRAAAELMANGLPDIPTGTQLRDMLRVQDDLRRRADSAAAAGSAAPLNAREADLLRRLDEADLFEDAANAGRVAGTSSPDAPGSDLSNPLLRPGGVAPVPTEGLTASQVAVMRRAGFDREGLAHFIPFLGPAPDAFATARVADDLDRSVRDGIDTVLREIVNTTDPNSVAGILSRQSVRILRDPKLTFAVVDDLGSIGAGRLTDNAGHYLIRLDETKIGGEAFGVKWHPVVVFAHEASHMAQVYLQEFMGKTIGRAIRELDASLRMSVLQNALANVMPGVTGIDPRRALEFSLEYAIDTQLSAFHVFGTRGPRFRTFDTFHDGLFQLDHMAAIGRVQAYFPQFSQRDILDVYLKIHRDRLANLSPDITSHPLAQLNNFEQRYRDMVAAAEAYRTSLAP